MNLHRILPAVVIASLFAASTCQAETGADLFKTAAGNNPDLVAGHVQTIISHDRMMTVFRPDSDKAICRNLTFNNTTTENNASHSNLILGVFPEFNARSIYIVAENTGDYKVYRAILWQENCIISEKRYDEKGFSGPNRYAEAKGAFNSMVAATLKQ